MKIFRNSLFLVLFMGLSPTVSHAQNNIRFNHLSVEDGLSQNAVTCIFQDYLGFMWFGTQDGLNRYDGYNIKIFKNDPSNPNSLSDNFIFSIYEDSENNLFIGTRNGSLNKFDRLNESFISLSPDSINLSNARMNSVLALYEDSSGFKWTGGLGNPIGLKRENKATGEITEFKNDPDDPSSLSDNKVYSVFKDRSGTIWVGTFQGLDRYDPSTGGFKHFRNDPDDPNSLSDNWVWPVFEDSHGNLWVGTVNGGLNHFDTKSEKFTNYSFEQTNPTGINDNFIFSIYEDSGGLIWIGTNSGGVNYFHPSSQAFHHYLHQPGNPNSLSDNKVLSMLADKSGIVWIGTSEKGLDRFNPKTGKFKNYSADPENRNSLISNSIVQIYEDSKGFLWLGTFSSGLTKFDTRNEQFEHFTHDPDNPNSLSEDRVYSIIEDKEGIMWIGTYAGGLNRFDVNQNKFTTITNIEGDSTSLSSNSVWSVFEDSRGDFWVGTFGGGLNLYDRNKNSFKVYTADPTSESSISDNNVISVYEDKNGVLWVGTMGGLNKYLRESDTFKSYRTQDGLPNDVIYGIIEDESGYIWLSTNYGISKFDPAKETFRNYDYNDGLQGNEFNQRSFGKILKTGEIFFGGANGFNLFHPDKIRDYTYLPPVSFTGFKRYNTDDAEGKPLIEKGIAVRDKIEISYKDNIVNFEFSALSYYNNFRNRYQYILEGFNENWIQLENEHNVTFTNLSPGDYKLQVRGSNGDGYWTENAASLSITIDPPWWKTNLAYFGYLVTAFGFLYGLRKFELNRREQKTQIRVSDLRIKAAEAEKRALAAENERKTKELDSARELQLSMLPHELPNLPNLEIAVFMRTATEVGGDYYDFAEHPDGSLSVAFGDATGHGLQAGTMVTLMKGFFTTDASRMDIQGFMSHCSNSIKRIKLGRILMSFSLLKIKDNKFSFSSGGMPPIYLFNGKSGSVEEIEMNGMPLGAMTKFAYDLAEREFNKGDMLLMLTDGLPEQMNVKEEMFDYSRVMEQFEAAASNSPEEIIAQLIHAGDEWMGEAQQEDDITMVVIKALG